MTDAEISGSSAELPGWVSPAIVAIVAGGAAFYFWLVLARWTVAEKWGNFGGAVGPFVGLLNAGALFAALYSVRLQRRELELQRQELRETREEMVEQRKQFERTANAQDALAASQQQLAKAQEKANLLALYQELAQRRVAHATLYQVITSIDIARLESHAIVQPGHSGRVLQGTKEPREHAARRVVEEGSRINELEKLLGLQLDEHEYSECVETDV